MNELCSVCATSLQSTNLELYNEVTALASECEGLSPNEVAEKLTANGALIKAILAWIQANPGQIMAWMTFILKMFGVVIPLPLPVQTEE